MLRTSFNDAWRVRPKQSSFLELFGEAKPWTELRRDRPALRADPPAAAEHLLGGFIAFQAALNEPASPV